MSSTCERSSSPISPPSHDSRGLSSSFDFEGLPSEKDLIVELTAESNRWKVVIPVSFPFVRLVSHTHTHTHTTGPHITILLNNSSKILNKSLPPSGGQSLDLARSELNFSSRLGTSSFHQRSSPPHHTTLFSGSWLANSSPKRTTPSQSLQHSSRNRLGRSLSAPRNLALFVTRFFSPWLFFPPPSFSPIHCLWGGKIAERFSDFHGLQRVVPLVALCVLGLVLERAPTPELLNTAIQSIARICGSASPRSLSPIEESVLSDALGQVLSTCKRLLTRYTTVFPENTRPGALESLIDLTNLAASEEDPAQLIATCITEAARLLIEEHGAGHTVESFTAIAEAACDAVERDKRYFLKPFTKVPGLALLSTECTVFAGWLGANQSAIMPHLEQCDSARVFTLFLRLKDLCHQLTAHVPGYTAPHLTTLFHGHVLRWMWQCSDNFSQTAASLVKIDTFHPIGDGQPYSTSVVDVHASLSSVCDFIDTVNWDEFEESAQVAAAVKDDLYK